MNINDVLAAASAKKEEAMRFKKATQSLLEAARELSKAKEEASKLLAGTESELLASESPSFVQNEVFSPAKTTQAKVTTVDPTDFVNSTAHMVIACAAPALVKDAALTAYSYNASQGLYPVPRIIGRILERMISENSDPANLIWVNSDVDWFRDYDFILQKRAYIDCKAHYASANKKGHLSGAIVKLSELTSTSIIMQYDLVQIGNLIHATRIGWFNKQIAEDAINNYLTTHNPKLALPMDKGNSIPESYEDLQFKITREGMKRDNELISFLKEKLGFSSPRSSLDYLLSGGGVLSRKGDDYRLQIVDCKYHHVKNDLKKPLRDPFGASGFVKKTHDRGNAYKFQLPDMITSELGCDKRNLSATSVIEAFKKAGKIVIIK